jgi:ribosome-associated toxin RatA of RatAB toxin-antitoxin module
VRSTIGIDVAAPPDLVFALVRDVERWPRLLPHYVAARRLGVPDASGRLDVRFVARRGLVPVLGLGVPVAWRSTTWADPTTRRLRFVHHGGATNGMDVTWHIEPADPGGSTARVEIEHVFTPRVPGWSWLIDRVFTRPIARRTLASFRDIAEAVAAIDTSGDAVRANPSA